MRKILKLIVSDIGGRLRPEKRNRDAITQVRLRDWAL
jgi:hypothetical protein